MQPEEHPPQDPSGVKRPAGVAPMPVAPPGSVMEAAVRIILKTNQIRKLGFGNYEVRSQTTKGLWYMITRDKNVGYTCTCPSFTKGGQICKHITAIMIHLQGWTQSRLAPLLTSSGPANSEPKCPYCGSEKFVKDGNRPTERGLVQRFMCKSCAHRFIPDSAFVKMKATPEAITASMDLFYKGVSLHSICDHLKQFYSIDVSHVSVLRWIRKYTALMRAFVDSQTPDAAGVWHTDEMMVRVKMTQPMPLGNPSRPEHYSWLWNLMDRDTRFLLAAQIHKRRGVSNARQVFAHGKAITRRRPLAVVHDGLESYERAFVKEFYSNAAPWVANVRSVGATRKGLNQRVERLNGSIRDRVTPMRGMYSDATAQDVVDGYRVYHNWLRPNMALGGKTPAEAAGIELGLAGNRWQELIAKSYCATRAKERELR